MRKTTLRDVARHLGLGKSTVQRALAGSPKVSARTSARVKEAAHLLGYRHDLFFAALAAHRRRPRSRSSVLIHYLFGPRRTAARTPGLDLSDTLREEASQFGLEVEPVDWGEFPDYRTIPGVLYQRGSGGLLVGICDARVHLSLHQCTNLPILCLQHQAGMPFHTVRFSVASRVRCCWSRLWEAGYRRIGCALVRHSPSLVDDDDRMGAALSLVHSVKEFGDQVPPLQIRFGALEQYAHWLTTYQPDAILAFHSGLWWETRRILGQAVPFVCLQTNLSQTVRHIPGTYDSKATLARVALRQMGGLIRDGETGIPSSQFQVVIEPFWHDGEGIPPAPDPPPQVGLPYAID